MPDQRGGNDYATPCRNERCEGDRPYDHAPRCTLHDPGHQGGGPGDRAIGDLETNQAAVTATLRENVAGIGVTQ
jgi:hypothetical protein